MQPVAQTLKPDPVVELCGLHNSDTVMHDNTQFLLFMQIPAGHTSHNPAGVWLKYKVSRRWVFSSLVRIQYVLWGSCVLCWWSCLFSPSSDMCSTFFFCPMLSPFFFFSSDSQSSLYLVYSSWEYVPDMWPKDDPSLNRLFILLKSSQGCLVIKLLLNSVYFFVVGL